jgi:hypothetical protein
MAQSRLMKTFLVWIMTGLMSVMAANEATPLAKIRTWYHAIQEGKASGEEKIKFQVDNASLGGEMVIRDYADGLKAITISYSAGDHGSAVEHFYYRKGILFFVFLEQLHRSLTDELDAEGAPVTRDTRVEQRVYLEDGKYFRLLRRKATGKSTENVKKLLAETAQSKVEAGDGTAEYIRRGRGLLTAKTGAEVLKVFGPDMVPAK